jgi:hypothetical protein
VAWVDDQAEFDPDRLVFVDETVTSTKLTRMADFALWAKACESAFRPTGTFEATYSNNRRDAIAK